MTFHIEIAFSVSSLAWFMSNQETSFVTIGQRLLANPLKYVRIITSNLIDTVVWISFKFNINHWFCVSAHSGSDFIMGILMCLRDSFT